VAKGGARPGAGRKPGSVTRKTREIAAKATAEGITPLEVMLRAMREHVDLADALREQSLEADAAVLTGEVDADTGVRLRRDALAAINAASLLAKDAAPYMHPKLANVTSNVSGDIRSQIKIVSEFEDLL
jgi:hypothetical protein